MTANTNPGGTRGDFLSQLVDRAHGRAPLVAPRPASLFEAPATAAAETAVEHDDVATPRPLPRVDVTHGVAPAPIPPMSAPTAAMPMPARHASPPAAPAVTTTVSRMEQVHLFTTMAAADTPAASLPAPAPQAVARPVAMPQASPHAVAAVPEATPNPRRDAADVPSRFEPSQRLPALVADRSVVATFAAMPAAHAPSRESAAPAAAPAAPVVTISIGRVDVRAAAPPASAPRASATPQPTRLAEYLGRKERTR
jgi:hypothetical protein